MVTLKNPQKFVILTLLLLSSVATAKEHKAATAKERKAIISTSEGDITVKLFSEDTPKTVLNFIGLSNGKKEWKDPKTGNQVKGKPLYNNTTFHRVIPDFMIQGGDPLGNGTGGPGYQFEDETNSKVVFDHPGILAMANSGPATNGSQFFITVKPTPWLNGKHTIFGEVVKGMDIVEKISKLPTGAQDAPQTAVVIKKIKISG
ncbi:MAG: peptidylprolyl isomerase [Bdellovibrionia bacterium]